jgi:AraC-like DNA-binding protein
MNDTDSLYRVEFGIPWASIGVKPKAGMEFNVDLCVNDNDTLVDFRNLADGPVRLFNYMSISGSKDFGYPGQWIKIKLKGEASLFTRISQALSKKWLFLMVAMILIIILLITWFRFRISLLKKIPERISLESSVLLETLTNSKLPIPKTSEQPIFGKAREYIAKRMDQPLRPEQMAIELAISLRNLERIFQKELDTTPNTFIILVKLEHAANLLKKRELTISEVAESVGFPDPAYFSRVFKKYFNQTPREFLAQNGRSCQ